MLRPLALVSTMALAAALTGCQTTASVTPEPLTAAAAAPETSRMSVIPLDVHTYARPNIARVTHVSLDLAADFEAKTLSGTATLDIQAQPGATEIILDIRDLDIRAIHTVDGAQALPYVIGDEQPFMGRPLTIQIGAARRIVVEYATRPEAAALQWLTPQQTAGGARPICSARARRSSPAPGCRPRTAPASARPGTPASSRRNRSRWS